MSAPKDHSAPDVELAPSSAAPDDDRPGAPAATRCPREVSDAQTLWATARRLAAAAELVLMLQRVVATAHGLPDALTFGPGTDVLDVITSLAELAADLQTLADFAVALQQLHAAVRRQRARNEHLLEDGLSGNIDQHRTG